MALDPMEARWVTLRQVGGDRLIVDMIDLFFQTVPQHLEKVQMAVGAGDLEAAGKAAHALAGSSINLGAAEMRERALALEQHAAEGAAEALPDLLRQLEEVWARTRDLLAARREALNP